MCDQQRDAKAGRIAERLDEVKNGATHPALCRKEAGRPLASCARERVDGSRMVASCSAIGVTAATCRCLAPQNGVGGGRVTFLLERWMNRKARSRAWLRKLGPSRTPSERTFEQCVSPSPRGDRRDQALHPSQIAAGAASTFLKKEKTSKLGRIDYNGLSNSASRHRHLGKGRVPGK
jgi:hypothetical protein